MQRAHRVCVPSASLQRRDGASAADLLGLKSNEFRDGSSRGSGLFDKRMCVTHLSLLRLRPSAAERTIQFHDRGELLALQRRKIEFAPKQVSLGVEHLQITVEPSLIAIG